jgi:hypothetical protein
MLSRVGAPSDRHLMIAEALARAERRRALSV